MIVGSKDRKWEGVTTLGQKNKKQNNFKFEGSKWKQPQIWSLYPYSLFGA